MGGKHIDDDNDKLDTDYHSFSKRKSTQENRTPPAPEDKKLEELAQTFAKELINRSDDNFNSNV
jgi:hypothetical protein